MVIDRARSSFLAGALVYGVLTATSSAPACAEPPTMAEPVMREAPLPVTGGPYHAAPNTTITLDGTRSSDSQGGVLTYHWDLTGRGRYDDSTLSRPVFRVGSASAGSTYRVCLKVLNRQNRSSIACTSVAVVASGRAGSPPALPRPVVTPSPPSPPSATPPAPAAIPTPVARPGGPYFTHARNLTLDGTASKDMFNQQLSYHWDLTNTWRFTDSTLVRPIFTIGNGVVGGTFVVCLKVTNVATNASSDAACTTVTVSP